MSEVLNNIRKYFSNSDTILGVGVVFILALIVIPLPGQILDLLISISLLSSMLILMTTLSSKGPADFTAFPTVLLVTTIYRLAVNVATTRMILTQGDASDSALIEAFGTFVVGGAGTTSLVVGIIIFIVLTLVQILVITKGATRVSEVAARFALDSMVGKQMAIDADMTAGYIDEAEARRRREELQTEMNFYGAMDGASKFVQGDVRLGLVLTFINIIGGLIVGTTIMGDSFGSALETYTKFTIGDGLVSQIPALLISTGTGVIITRAVGQGALPDEINKQLLSNPGTLYVTGGILAASGLIPGFPTVAMFAIGGLLIFLGTRVDRGKKTEAELEEKQREKQAEEKKPESYMEHLKTDPLEVEVGYNLIPLVDPKAGGTLLEQISKLRRRFASESGLIVPPVRIKDNMSLEPGEYTIRLQGSVIASSKLEADKLLAINTGRATGELEGTETVKEPTYHMDAHWIDPSRKAEAEGLQYDVVDPSTVIATQLSDIIYRNSQEIMGRQEVKNILDSVRQDNPVVVDEVLNEKKIPIGRIQGVLQHLLKEGVSIRNMTRILESVANHYESSHGDPEMIAEMVRLSLKRQIVSEYLDENKVLHCVTIDPSLDRKLRDGISHDPQDGLIMTLKPDVQVAVRDALIEEFQQARTKIPVPVFLCSKPVRPGVFYLLESGRPEKDFAVIAHEEIPKETEVQVMGQVSLKKQEQTV